ncbi:MAG: hypothetical protein AMXMBFR75_30230 [Candidatus Hinthialibacteria bacterium]
MDVSPILRTGANPPIEVQGLHEILFLHGFSFNPQGGHKMCRNFYNTLLMIMVVLFWLRT